MTKAEVVEIVNSWNDGSFELIVNLLEGGADVEKNDVLHSVIVGYVDGKLKEGKAVKFIKDLVNRDQSLCYVLGDVFNLIDVELGCSENKKSQDEFHHLLEACADFFPESVLKQTLEPDTLAKIGLIPVKKNFDVKYVRIKTRMYYKQQKFNLLREESEGYAKLIVELQQDFSKIDLEYLKRVTESLIGYFNLDPNRVLDLLIEALESRPEEWLMITELIKHQQGATDTVTHLLGFKFKSYKSERETPAGLYKALALLVHKDLVNFDLIYSHLHPSEEMIKGQQKKIQDEADKYAKKMNTVSLTDKKDKTDDGSDRDSAQEMLEWNNQKLGLCRALIELGSVEKAQRVFQLFPPYFATAHPSIVTALSRLLYSMTEQLYSKFSGLPSLLLKQTTRYEAPLLPLPVVKEIADFERHVVPLLDLIGPCIATDPVLMTRISRICRNILLTERRGSSSNRLGSIEPSDRTLCVLSAVDCCLLPALSLLENNCCLSDELWGIVKLLPYTHRYNLYGRWKNNSLSKHPDLIRARARCLDRSKYLMKRLTKENVKQSGRHLGKISHCNPGVVFDCILGQIQRYDNLINPVVESLKYLSSMSYDVLTFCLIEALSSPEKERMKTEETNISLWLSSLASFAGLAYRKYSVDLTGLIQYVLNQLKMCKSYDLAVLREVVQKMSGIEIADEITDDQLNALSGGELLKVEGAYFAIVRNTKRSSSRLKEALISQELAVPACILIAQQRDSILYRETSNKTHVKLLAKLYDQCQDTLEQLGSFLASQLSAEEFSRRIPPVDQLVLTYHVPTDAAFFLLRPCINYHIQTKLEAAQKEYEKANPGKTASSSRLEQLYTKAVEVVLNPVVDAVKGTKDQKVWDDLNASFFVDFWSLSNYDLDVPHDAYDKQVSKMEQTKTETDRSKDLHASKKKKEMDRCQGLIDRLQEERKKQVEHSRLVIERLKHQKDKWFPSTTAKTEMVTQFLQHCIFPRCCFTLTDAVYCAKFIHTLHVLRTPNFSTLILMDRIFNDITFTMTSCSENEVGRYARFLNAVLNIVMHWHSSKEVFGKECEGFPGFITNIRKGSENPASSQIDFENFRHVCHKWHFRTTKAMASCLESKNYIQIRNALVVLTKIQTNFPRIKNYALAIERRVDRVAQDEKGKRPDIYALALGYSGQLKQRKSSWVDESAFHVMSDRKDDGKGKRASKGAAKSAANKSSTSKDKTSNKEAKVKEEVRVKQEPRVKEERHTKRTEVAQTNGKDPSEPAAKKSRDSTGRPRSAEDRRSDTFGPAAPPIVIKQEPVDEVKPKERRREKKREPAADGGDAARDERVEIKRRKADPSQASEWVEQTSVKKQKRSSSSDEKRVKKRTPAEEEVEPVERRNDKLKDEGRNDVKIKDEVRSKEIGDGEKHRTPRPSEKESGEETETRRSNRDRSKKKKSL